MKTLKYAWRFLMRSKSYTIINLLGLAFSLACSIILMRYIHRELTVDAHSVDPEHIIIPIPVSYTHLRAHETGRNLVCRLLLEKKKKRKPHTREKIETRI